MPPGPLATSVVDPEVIRRGLIPPGDLYPKFDPDIPFEERKYAPPLGDKLLMLFQAEYPGVHGVLVQSVWAAGELVQYEFDFNKYVRGKDLAKQEGLIFRHILRLILLLGEFAQITPPGLDPQQWRSELRELADRLTECCREVDPRSTEHVLAQAAEPDALLGTVAAVPGALPASRSLGESSTAMSEELPEEDFGEGLE